MSDMADLFWIVKCSEYLFPDILLKRSVNNVHIIHFLYCFLLVFLLNILVIYFHVFFFSSYNIHIIYRLFIHNFVSISILICIETIGEKNLIYTLTRIFIYLKT